MIRIALSAIGFLAITFALIYFQPGAPRRALDTGVVEQTVTRNDPAIGHTLPDVAAAPPLGAVSPPVAPQPALAMTPQAPAASAATAPGAPDDLRRLTWDTVAGLNAATGRNSAPGQPGSLLHAIVQRSLDAAPVASAKQSLPDLYTVQDGDSLISIATALYGDVNMAGPLFAANQGILSDPGDLRPGQVLSLPNS